MNPVAPSPQNMPPSGSGALRPGERLQAEVVAKGGAPVLRMKGAEYPVKYQGDAPRQTTVQVEIVKVHPQIEVRVVEEGAKPPAEPAGRSIFQAKAASLASLLMPEKADLPLAERMRGFLLRISPQDLPAMARQMGSVRLSVITPESIRTLIKNSGIFFENKLAAEESITGDRKALAALRNDQTSWDGITRMQMASVLLQEGIFSFFETDGLVEDGVVLLRREKAGVGFYCRMIFTALGETVVSIVPSYDGRYHVTVRTEEDISPALQALSVRNAVVRWKRLRAADAQIFDIKNKLIAKLGRLDIFA